VEGGLSAFGWVEGGLIEEGDIGVPAPMRKDGRRASAPPT